MTTITFAHPWTLAPGASGRRIAYFLLGQAHGAVLDIDIADRPPADLPTGVIVVAHARVPAVGDGPNMPWTQAAIKHLHDACKHWLDTLPAGASLALWPRAGELISDVPSALTLWRTFDGAPLGFVLDPEALITPSMRERRDDHLERIAATLAGHPRVAFVVDRGGLPPTFAPALPRLSHPPFSFPAEP